MPVSQKVGEVMDFTIAKQHGWLPYRTRRALRVPVAESAS